ncbi:MAG: DNA polymerase III subunit gamma/tau, partial [Clostridia bacterium]|nr:DNA polymerase III subunit gamma/tau [Clostridia bacterium]
MYRALYRKWRPQSFDEVCGQEHITTVLKNQVLSSTVSHAYLFCGTHGTGKTTCAKILAKAVNCENPIDGSPCGKCSSCVAIDNGTATDVLEIDAASNNGVDSIRAIRDEVVYPPSTLKKRVYIVDEVHMLTDSANNALLKTLEEPPEYVMFVLATTELQKIPSTIISRCQRFEFRRIDGEVIGNRVKHVCDEEGINIDEESVNLIARLSDGAM